MAVLPKFFYRFIAIPIKIPDGFSAEFDKLILKSYRSARDLEEPKQSWKRKNKVGGLTLANFKTNYKATVK